jgi:alpha-glucosidase
MPYFYTLAWEASQKGYPLIRPLFWYNSDEPALWSVDDAFYLGNSLIVYPVFEEGGRSRLLTVPPGHWYNFWDDTIVEGMAQVELAAPLEQMPLLVKAGSILPMVVNNCLVLHLYPPDQGDCEDCIYSDAGDGYGEWRLDHFRLIRLAEGLELCWEQQGDFPCLYPFAYHSIQLQVHGFQPRQLWVDGQEIIPTKHENERSPQFILPSPFRQAYFKGEFIKD